MQELGKFNLKINVIPNGLEKYMSFTINNKLSFIDSFQFLSSSLDLVKQKGFYPYEYISDFETLKKNYLAKKSFIVCQLIEKLVKKNMNMLMFGINLK